VSRGGLDRGACTKASPCATVSYALTKAPSGATIEVSGTIDDHPVISSPVTITTWPGGPAGSPAVLDGTPSGTVIRVLVGPSAGLPPLDDARSATGTGLPRPDVAVRHLIADALSPACWCLPAVPCGAGR